MTVCACFLQGPLEAGKQFRLHTVTGWLPAWPEEMYGGSLTPPAVLFHLDSQELSRLRLLNR